MVDVVCSHGNPFFSDAAKCPQDPIQEREVLLVGAVVMLQGDLECGSTLCVEAQEFRGRQVSKAGQVSREHIVAGGTG